MILRIQIGGWGEVGSGTCTDNILGSYTYFPRIGEWVASGNKATLQSCAWSEDVSIPFLPMFTVA